MTEFNTAHVYDPKKIRYAGAASPLDESVADPKKHASTPHDCVTIPNLVTVGENVWA